MFYIKIDSERCKGCSLCVNVCPKGLIKAGKSLNKKGISPVVFIKGDCSGCLACVSMCPDYCIEVYK